MDIFEKAVKNTPKTWRILAAETIFLIFGFCILVSVFSVEDRGQYTGHLNYVKIKDRKEIVYRLEQPLPFAYEMKSLKLTPKFPSTFLKSIFPNLTHLSPELDNYARFPDDTDSLSEEDLFLYVLKSVSTETYKCRKMVRLGGGYCTRRPDGEKVICWDPSLNPIKNNNSCLVYSFGIGHDISFEKAASWAGCDIFSFDSDYKHLRYPRDIFPRVTFLKVRLGWSRVIEVLTDPSGRFPFVYRPLEDIMLNLGHHKSSLTILKIDIENSEWDCIEKHIFHTKILERTQHVALEIHFDSLYPESQYYPHSEGRHEALKQYARVIKGLQDRGFRLAYFEPNYNVPYEYELFGQKFNVYFETSWVNINLQPGQPTEPTPDLDSFDTMPSVEIIHNPNY